MHPMLRRLASGLVTLLVASLVIFLVLDLLPGNAATALLGTAARPDTIAAMTTALGLDRPAPLRYLAWIGGLLHGDFGPSATYGVPVGQLIAERLPVTMPLAAMALLLALLTGVPLGVAGAARPGSIVDRLGTALAQLGIAVPDFWVGLLLILAFSTGLHWFAAGGFPGWRPDPLAAGKALLLPAVALALPQAAVLVRTTRAAVLEEMPADYVRTAHAKGLRRARVMWRHIAPNAAAPVLTVLGLQLSFLLAGAVLVENVFNLPGLGRLATQALAQRDLPVMRGVALVFAALVIVINGAVDGALLRLDPRQRAA